MSSNNPSVPPAQPRKHDSDITARRKQLFAQGYSVLPTHGKQAVEKGWNSESVWVRLSPSYIEKWERRYSRAQSTGVRILGGLAAIDIDIDDPLASEVLQAIEDIAPEIAHTAPMRYGHSEHKVALFCRLVLQPGDQAFGRWFTPKYESPDGKTHLVEIFGSAQKPVSKCSRQFAVDGPHPDGGDYVFAEGPSLFDTRLEQLPVLSLRIASDILARAKVLLEGKGWTVKASQLPQSGNKAYDITDRSRFDTEIGNDLSYDELVEAFNTFGEFRCTTSFMPGHDAERHDTCWVNIKNTHNAVAVYSHSDQINHFHERYKPAHIDRVFNLSGLGVLPPHTLVPAFELRKTDGVIRSTLYNARLALQATGLICSHDTFHNKMWVGRGEAANPSEPLPRYCGEITDMLILVLRIHLRELFGVDFTERYVREAVLEAANANSFDPVCDMLAEAEASWDKKARLDRMAVDYFNAQDTPLNRAFVRLTMIAAVARARNPGCKFDQILTMISPEGLNKSSAWLVLAGEDNFSDESIIGKDSREVMENLAICWIHESADLAGMLKREIEAVKAFASRQVDRARPAYGRFLVTQPRHSIEVATTNNDKFLLSTDGNRRFWPLHVTRSIDLQKLRADRLQLWGEAAHYQSQGESLTLSEHLWGLAGQAQEAARIPDIWEEILATLSEADHFVHGDGDYQVVSTIDLLEYKLRGHGARSDYNTGRRLAAAMKALGWQRDKVWINSKQVRGYRRLLTKALKP